MTGEWQPTRRTGAIPIDLRADQLVTAFDLIADGLALVDGDGKMVLVNRPFCHMFGYSSSDLIGQSIEMLVPVGLRREHRHRRTAFVEDRTTRPMGRQDLDIEGRHVTGRLLPIEVQLAPLPGTDLVAATVRDVTDIRRVAVDRALDRLELRAAQARVAALIAAQDLALQQLFALGAHFEAQASRSTREVVSRFSQAVVTVDAVIESIREAAHGSNDEQLGPSP